TVSLRVVDRPMRAASLPYAPEPGTEAAARIHQAADDEFRGHVVIGRKRRIPVIPFEALVDTKLALRNRVVVDREECREGRTEQQSACEADSHPSPVRRRTRPEGSVVSDPPATQASPAGKFIRSPGRSANGAAKLSSARLTLRGALPSASCERPRGSPKGRSRRIARRS